MLMISFGMSLYGCLAQPSPSYRRPPVETSALSLELDGSVTIRGAVLLAEDESVVEIFGVRHPARGFDIAAPVAVQLCEPLLGEQDCFEDVAARFTLRLAADPRGRICRSAMQAVQEYWRDKDDGYRASYRLLPTQRFGSPVDGSFVLIIQPEDNLPGASWLVYRPGLAVEIELAAVGGAIRGGGLNDLVRSRLLLLDGETHFEIPWKPAVEPDEMLRLIAEEWRCPR